MEAKKNCVLMEHENKENIPPFFMSKKPVPNGEDSKCALVKRINGRRRPLRDVTGFYRAVERFESRLPLSVSVTDFSSSWKRKAVDDGAEERPCSKILRREYR